MFGLFIMTLCLEHLQLAAKTCCSVVDCGKMMNYGVDFVHEKAVEWVELIKIKEDNLRSFRIHTDFVFH